MPAKIKISDSAQKRLRSHRTAQSKKTSSALSSIFYLVIMAAMGGGAFVYNYFIHLINKTENLHTRRTA